MTKSRNPGQVEDPERLKALDRELKDNLNNLDGGQRNALIKGLENKLKIADNANPKTKSSTLIASPVKQAQAATTKIYGKADSLFSEMYHPANNRELIAKSITLKKQADLEKINGLLNELSDKLDSNNSMEIKAVKKILRCRTAEQHIDNAANQYLNYLHADYKINDQQDDSVVLKQKEVVSRLLTLISGDYLYSTNPHAKNLPSDAPAHNAASILNGGRILIQLPPCSKEDMDNILKGILGYTIKDAIKENIFYARPFASHGQRVGKNGIILEEKYSPTKAKDVTKIAMNAALGSHFAMDVGIGWDGAKPIDGCNGHLYFNFLAPTETSPGSIMFGLETSAPGHKNPYGAVHGASAISGEFTPTGVKTSDWPYEKQKAAGQILSPDNHLDHGLIYVLPSKTDALNAELDRIKEEIKNIDKNIKKPINVNKLDDLKKQLQDTDKPKLVRSIAKSTLTPQRPNQAPPALTPDQELAYKNAIKDIESGKAGLEGNKQMHNSFLFPAEFFFRKKAVTNSTSPTNSPSKTPK